MCAMPTILKIFSTLDVYKRQSSANARPGDLIFFVGTYDTPGVSHVGIYVGGGKMPVSYTHLDVYKRQTTPGRSVSSSRMWIISLRSLTTRRRSLKLSAICITPVCYTHLDVYKRQSIRNCLTVFQRDPVLAGAIAYNSLTDRKDIIKPIGFHRESTALTDTDMKYCLLYTSRCV